MSSLFYFNDNPLSVEGIYYENMLIPRIYYGSLLAYQGGGQPPIPSDVLMLDHFGTGEGYWMDITERYINLYINCYNSEYDYWTGRYFNCINDATNRAYLENLKQDKVNFDWENAYYNNAFNYELTAPCLFKYTGGLHVINSLDDLYQNETINYATYELAKNKNYSIKAYCPYYTNFNDGYQMYVEVPNEQTGYNDYLYLPAYIYVDTDKPIYFNNNLSSEVELPWDLYFTYGKSIFNSFEKENNYYISYYINDINVPKIDFVTDINYFIQRSYYGGNPEYIPNYFRDRNTFINVKNMVDAFANTILTSPYYTPNAINMYKAYYSAPRTITEVYFPSNVKDISYTYSRANINSAICPSSVVNFDYTYYLCWDIEEAVCGNNVISMVGTYEDCNSLLTAACGPKVKDMSYAYNNCSNLITPVCGPSVENMSSTYALCSNLTTAVVGSNVIDMSNAYNSCSNLTTPVCGLNVKNMRSAYSSCNNLDFAISGPNVIDMNSAYSECENLKTACFAPNVTDADSAYYYCTNCNSIYYDNNYEGFSGYMMDNLINMGYTFAYTNLFYGYVPGKAKNLYNCYENCSELREILFVNNFEQNIEDISGICKNCEKLSEIATIGDNIFTRFPTVEYGYQAFDTCTNLTTGYAFASNSDWMYSDCSNLNKIIILPQCKSARRLAYEMKENSEVYCLIDGMNEEYIDLEQLFWATNMNIFVYPNNNENSFNQLLYTNPQRFIDSSYNYYTISDYPDTNSYIITIQESSYTYSVHVHYTLNDDIINTL